MQKRANEQPGSRWSARSEARTNDLDAGSDWRTMSRIKKVNESPQMTRPLFINEMHAGERPQPRRARSVAASWGDGAWRDASAGGGFVGSTIVSSSSGLRGEDLAEDAFAASVPALGVQLCVYIQGLL